MTPRAKAVFLSGLVFPGLGQVVNKQVAKGAVIMGSLSVFLLWLVVRIFQLTWKTMAITGDDGLQSMRMDPDTIAHLHNQAWALNWWLAALIMAIWVYSIVDAYFLPGKENPAAKQAK
jgi:hypothetical protein